MIRPASANFKSGHRSGEAILLLNGNDVGRVKPTGWDTSWGFGLFQPNDAFSEFAPVYGMWSVLMHADGDADRLSKDTIVELAKAEAMLDSIHAKLVFVEDQQHVDVVALTIDGELLEWKEF